MESGKVVLVTAAAGGTGQFAVQVLSYLPILSESLVLASFHSVLHMM